MLPQACILLLAQARFVAGTTAETIVVLVGPQPTGDCAVCIVHRVASGTFECRYCLTVLCRRCCFAAGRCEMLYVSVISSFMLPTSVVVCMSRNRVRRVCKGLCCADILSACTVADICVVTSRRLLGFYYMMYVAHALHYSTFERVLR